MRTSRLPTFALLVSSATVVGCSADPLQQIALRNDVVTAANSAEDDGASANSADDVNDDGAGNDDGNNDGSDDLPTEPGDDVVIDNGDNTPGPLQCASGAEGTSYRDTLPTLPSAVPVPSTLAGGDGIAASTCAGEAVRVTSDERYWDNVEAEQGHVRGQYYFEADVRSIVDGRVTIGVFAAPAAAYSMGFAPFIDEVAAAGTTVDAAGIVSVAVDLDAGVVALYLDGVLRESRTLAVLPGVGAWVAAVDSGGSVTALNLGSAPFTYALPEGYAAWQTNEDGAGGACVTPALPTVAAANLDVICGSIDECGSSLSSYVSDASAETELVVLGAYDTDSQANWTWGYDDEGNPIEAPVEGGHIGAALVELQRPGRIALVLSAYEPTAWSLVVGPNTELVSVSVYGFHAATITGVPEGIPVDVQSICTDTNGGGNCDGMTGADFPIAPHQWPFDIGGGDTQGFVRYIEEQLCLPLKVFAGAYNTRGFHVE